MNGRFAMWRFAPALLVGAFIVASIHAFVIGLPAHALLPRRWRYSPLANGAGGFLVGGLPLPLLMVLLSEIDPGMSQRAFLASLAAEAGSLGLFGAVGGFVFWLIVRQHAEEPE